MNTPRPAARALSAVLLLVFVAASAVLLRLAFSGFFKLILPVQSPLNAESIAALAFVLAVLLRAAGAHPSLNRCTAASSLLLACCVALVSALPFLITLNAPLLHDSYAHVAEARSETWLQMLRHFTHPTPNDLFFRPLGYLSYWLDFKWAGYDPLPWHISNLILHIANTWLVFVLATQLYLNRFSASITALIFGVHGSRPEVVSWAAARFDLLAALFVLLSLVALNRYLDTQRARWYAVMICCAVLSVLSKEAAFCLPFLVAGLLPFKPRSARKQILSASAVLFGVCGAAFLYRFWIIGGFGGYRTAGGREAVLQFNLVHTLKSLLFRQWAILFFPIDWSTGVTIWVKGSIVVMVMVMLGLLAWSTASRFLLLAAILWEIIACLPVQHLLLMTADLAGARVLYLPVLGLALFWGVLMAGCHRPLIRYLLAAGLLSFQFVVLCHNLKIWRDVAFLSEHTCRELGSELARDPRPVLIRDLPVKWHGVFFLRNGFPQCVEMNSNEPANRVYLANEGPSPPDARIFSWNDSTERLQEVTSDKK